MQSSDLPFLRAFTLKNESLYIFPPSPKDVNLPASWPELTHVFLKDLGPIPLKSDQPGR